MHKIRLDAWAGLVLLLLLLVIGVPVLLGFGNTLIPRGWWALVFATCIVSMIVMTWNPNRSRMAVAALIVSTLSAWIVVYSAPSGFLAVVLVVIAACAVYVISFPWASVLIAANTAALLAAGHAWGVAGSELVLHVLLYAGIQFASALSAYTSLREETVRRELAEKNVELRAAQALLRESVQSDERLRISRDLHDSIGHSLTVLALELEAAKHGKPDQIRPRVEHAGDLARGLLDEVRATVSELRRGPRDLASALEQLIRDVPDLQVELDVASDVEVGERETAVLVRAVQEIVTNALRHSDAATLNLRIYRGEGGETVLDALDDGRGAEEPQFGNGLKGLLERVEGLGGTVSVDGRSGFHVKAQVPSV